MGAVDLPRHFTEIKLWKIYLRVGGTMFVTQFLINVSGCVLRPGFETLGWGYSGSQF